MNEEEIKQRKQELRKLRETTVEQKQQEFLEKWREVIVILKKTKSEFAEVALDNINNGIPPQGKSLELCNELLAKSKQPTPTRRKKTNATTTRNNRTKNKKTGSA